MQDCFVLSTDLAVFMQDDTVVWISDAELVFSDISSLTEIRRIRFARQIKSFKFSRDEETVFVILTNHVCVICDVRSCKMKEPEDLTLLVEDMIECGKDHVLIRSSNAFKRYKKSTGELVNEFEPFGDKIAGILFDEERQMAIVAVEGGSVLGMGIEKGNIVWRLTTAPDIDFIEWIDDSTIVAVFRAPSRRMSELLFFNIQSLNDSLQVKLSIHAEVVIVPRVKAIQFISHRVPFNTSQKLALDLSLCWVNHARILSVSPSGKYTYESDGYSHRKLILGYPESVAVVVFSCRTADGGCAIVMSNGIVSVRSDKFPNKGSVAYLSLDDARNVAFRRSGDSEAWREALDAVKINIKTREDRKAIPPKRMIEIVRFHAAQMCIRKGIHRQFPRDLMEIIAFHAMK